MQILSVSGDRKRMNEVLYGMRDNNTIMSRNAIEILRKFTGLSVKMKKKEEAVEMGRLCKALEEQRKIDLEEGRKEGQKDAAVQMKKEGFSTALIAKILQLSESGVNQLLS